MNNIFKKSILTFLVIIATVAMSGFLYIYASYGSRVVTDNTTSDKNNPSTDKKDENIPPGKEIEGITNILLLGVDERIDGDVNHSDTMMILTLDNVHKKIKLTSIMRDAYVSIPGYSDQKITHAYAYEGYSLLMDTIEQNFNIKLDKFAKINFAGFKDLIDAIGGLDITLQDYEEVNELNRCLLLDIYEDPKSELTRVKEIVSNGDLLWTRDEGAPLLKDNYNISQSQYNYLAEQAGFVEETGTLHLNGAQSLAYSRMRHVGNGSYDRTKRQRGVVDLIINKLKDTPTLSYLSIANKLLPYVTTNVEFDEALGLATTAISINNFNIEQLQIPPTKLSDGRIYGEKGWVLLMDKYDTTNVLHDFVFEDIPYDEDQYLQFDYFNSDYYYYVPETDNSTEEETDDSNENNSNEETDTTPPEETDNSGEETDNSNGNNNSNEENTDTDNSNGNSTESEKESETDNNNENNNTDNSENDNNNLENNSSNENTETDSKDNNIDIDSIEDIDNNTENTETDSDSSPDNNNNDDENTIDEIIDLD